MNIATAQWPIRYEGLVQIRDLKIKMADGNKEFIKRANDEFWQSINEETGRRKGA